MIYDELKLPFRIYNSLDKQDRFIKENNPANVKLQSFSDTFLPFQFRIPTTTSVSVSEIDIVDLEGNVLESVPSSVLKITGPTTEMGYAYITYKAQSLGITLPYGLLYLTINTSAGTFYSEVFFVDCDSPTFGSTGKYTLFEFDNGGCNLGPILYSEDFISMVLLESELESETPTVEVEGTEDGFGNVIPVQQKYVDNFSISDLVPKYLSDALVLMAMHKSVKITLPNNLYTAPIHSIVPTANENNGLYDITIKFSQYTEYYNTACCGTVGGLPGFPGGGPGSGGPGGGGGNVSPFLQSLAMNGKYFTVGGVKPWVGGADVATTATNASFATVARALQSTNYTSPDMFGEGMKFDVDQDGKAFGVLDNLTVRGRMTVNELAILTMKSLGGTLVVSNNAKVKDVIGTFPNYTATIDDEEGHIGVELEEDDIAACKVFNSSKQKYYLLRVTGVGSDSFSFAIIDGSDEPEPGDEIVQLDNYTNEDRQGIIYLTNSDNGAPFLDVRKGMYTSASSSLKVRLGNLAGITDPDFGTLMGYGAYLTNIYAKGVLIAAPGSNVALKSELTLLEQQLDDVARDGIASPREKKLIINPNYEILKKKVSEKIFEASALGLDSTDLYIAFYTYLQPYVLPIIANLDTTSPDDGAPYDGELMSQRFIDADNALAELSKRVQIKQKELSDAANTKVDNLQTGIRNLIKNSSFELADQNFFSAPGTPNRGVVSLTTETIAYNGTKCLKFVSSINATVAVPANILFIPTFGATGTGSGQLGDQYALPIVRGKTITTTVMVKGVGSSIGKNICLKVFANHPAVPNNFILGTNKQLTSGWIQISVNIFVPADCTLFAFHVLSDNAVVGDIWYTDAFSSVVGNVTPGDWTVAPEDIIAQSAKLVKLSGDAQIITVSKTGVVTPSNPFNVVAITQNTTVASWAYNINGIGFSSALPAGVTRSGDVVTINPATSSFKTLSIRASDNIAISDVFTIARAVDGQDGAGFTITGTVDTYADLPTTGLSANDMYVVRYGDGEIKDGLLYIFNGTSFPANGNGVEFKGDQGDPGDPGLPGQPGAPGADGKDAIVGYLTNESVTLSASSSGIVSSFMPASGNFRVYDGITLVSSEAAFSVVSETGCTVAIDATGYYSASAMTTDTASATLRAIYNSVTIDKVLSLAKSKKGDTGLQGVPGTPGADGVTYYTWIRYADTPTSGMSNEGTGKDYIGIATNKTTPVESDNYADYTWSKTKGETGNQGIPGPPGANGAPTFTWLKYSDFADGTGLYDDPTANTKYIGIAPNKSTQTEGTDKSEYTWSLFKGADGANAPLLYLSSSAETMVFDENGVPSPISQTINFEAKLQNVSGTASFTAIPFIGSASQAAITLGGTENTRTLTQAQWPANVDRVVVTATLGSLSDVVTIVRLNHGAKGVDGYTVLLTNESHTFPGGESAAIAASTTTDVLSYKGASAMAPTSITVGVMPTGMTSSVTGTTVTFNVSASLVSPSGTVPITIVLDGKSFVRHFSYAISFKGATGANGISITGVDVEFSVNTNATVAPTTGWTTTAPALTAGQQLWTRTKTAYSSGNPTYSNPANITPQTGQTGATGTGVSSITEEYYLSTSKTTQTGSSWVTTPPTWVQGQYMWTRVKIVYTNPTNTVYTPPIVSDAWEAVNNIVPGGRNYVANSRVYSVNQFYGGHNLTEVNDPKMGVVIEITKNTPGEYQAPFNLYEYNSLLNTQLLFFVIAKNMAGTGQLLFGGWSETVNAVHTGLNDANHSKIDLGDGWFVYIGTLQSGPTLGGGVFGLNSIEGTWRIYAVGVQKGNKYVDWSEAPEDVQARIQAAQTAANNAASDATAALTQIGNVISNNVLDAGEKRGERRLWEEALTEKSTLNAQATSYGITTENTSYNIAFQALSNYLNDGSTWSTGIPLWLNDSNLAVNTPIDGATYRANWKTLFDAEIALRNAVTSKIKQIADNAQNAANSKNQSYPSINSVSTNGYMAGDKVFQGGTQPVSNNGYTFYPGKVYETKVTRVYPLPNNWPADFLEVKTGIGFFRDVDLITTYSADDILNPTVTKTRGGKEFLAGALYQASTGSTSFNAAHWVAVRTEDSARNTKNFLTTPYDYQEGDTWTPATTINIGGTIFEAGDTYEAITPYAGALVPSHWRLSNKTSYLKKVFGESTVVGNGVLMAGIVGAMSGGVVKSYMKAIAGDDINLAGGVTNFGLVGIETQSYALYHSGAAMFSNGKVKFESNGSGYLGHNQTTGLKAITWDTAGKTNIAGWEITDISLKKASGNPNDWYGVTNIYTGGNIELYYNGSARPDSSYELVRTRSYMIYNDLQGLQLRNDHRGVVGRTLLTLNAAAPSWNSSTKQFQGWVQDGMAIRVENGDVFFDRMPGYYAGATYSGKMRAVPLTISGTTYTVLVLDNTTIGSDSSVISI